MDSKTYTLGTDETAPEERPLLRMPRSKSFTLIRLLVVLLLASTQGACLGGSSIRLAGPRPSSESATPPSSESPGGRRHDPSPAEAEGTGSLDLGSTGALVAREVVETALEAMGTPYLWGGSDSDGFDCSGLIQFAYSQHGIELPRVSRDQLLEGDAVELDLRVLQPGDILGLSQLVGGDPAHVALYVGEGRFIHSSTRGVRLSSFDNRYWMNRLVAARRILR